VPIATSDTYIMTFVKQSGAIVESVIDVAEKNRL